MRRSTTTALLGGGLAGPDRPIMPRVIPVPTEELGQLKTIVPLIPLAANGPIPVGEGPETMFVPADRRPVIRTIGDDDMIDDDVKTHRHDDDDEDDKRRNET